MNTNPGDDILITGDNKVISDIINIAGNDYSFCAPVSIDSIYSNIPHYKVCILALDQVPNENILDLIRFLKTCHSEKPVYVVSRELRDNDVARLFKAGIDEYVRVDEIEQLRTLIMALVNSSKDEVPNGNNVTYLNSEYFRFHHPDKRISLLIDESPAVLFNLRFQGDQLKPVYVSRNIETLFGIKRQDFLNDSELFEKNIHANERGFVAKGRSLLFHNKTRSHLFRFKMADGNYRWIQEDLNIVTDNQGRRASVVGVWIDMQQHKEIEEQVFRSEERLRRSQNYAHIGTWDWDIKTGELYWSEQIGPLFGYETGALETTYENFLASVHEDDRESVINAVNNCLEHGDEYHVEHRCVWPDGSVHWILEKGDATRSADGEPLHMLGVVQDITERKQLELELARKKEILQLSGEGVRRFVMNGDVKKISESLLKGALEVTESEYGLIGEVKVDATGQAFLSVHYLSDVHWDEVSRKQYEGVIEQGLEFRKLDTLFGEAIKTGQVIISNKPTADPRSGGAPEGHPVLDNFLGVPVYYGDSITGLVCLANREEGYSNEFVDLLEPLCDAYGVILQTARMQEREAATVQAIVNAKEEAELANQAKTDFLARMSHALRTPLNAILGFSQLMQLSPDLSDRHLENINIIRNSGVQLLQLIDEILDLAKIETGNIDVSLQSVSLKNLLSEVFLKMQPLAKGKGISLSMEDILNDTYIRADEVRLKQVLVNIVTNAIAYNKKNGSVNIGHRVNEADVQISISDTGIGIPKEKVADLFTPFNRLGQETGNVQGIGIALVISRHLMELMGGEITFNSALNKGTTFTLFLLKDEAATQGIEQYNTEQELQQLNSGGHKTLLYIEDNPVNLKLVEQICESLVSVDLISADNGDLGLVLATKNLPDLILLDINLPGKNGFEVLRELRSNQVTSEIPVVALSGNAMPKDIQKGRDEGFNDYLTKPIEVKKLLHVLTEHFTGEK